MNNEKNNDPMLDAALVERLAEASHLLYCKQHNPAGPGVVPGGLSDDPSLVIPSWSKTFQALPEDEKEQNRSMVRDIPAKLALVGLGIELAGSATPEASIDLAAIERLSKLEHVRWVKAKIAAGWRHAPVTDKPKKRHDCLVPWSLDETEMRKDYTADEVAVLGMVSLPEHERQKDRDVIDTIPLLLREAGYKIVRRSPML